MLPTRDRALLFLLLAVLPVALFLLALGRERAAARTRVAFEDEALARLRRVAAAQAAFHERHQRYGWLEELEADDLLAGLEPGRDDGALHLRAPRYRIDVLLPEAAPAGKYVRIAARTAGVVPDARLIARHFAVVARPWGAGLTGHRTLYLDETGDLRVSEGVTDVLRTEAPALPDLHLSVEEPREVGGHRWYPADALPPR